VDLLVAKTPFKESALTRARLVPVLGTACSVITPEDLIVYKLLANRPREIEDKLDAFLRLVRER
jgi:hypothetical protein